ncbi:hypothetical protein FQA47_000420 [Oryzias melastigma]|uniref:Uncharacterized protein n=1 Tax=Oryzias melastigma TaxID=30732 RepID=A0A834CGL1_ORYME|nr:hypothetical protein FQA47_000420 [Oryzias melastigma]
MDHFCFWDLFSELPEGVLPPLTEETGAKQWEQQALSPGPGSILISVAVCDSFVMAQCVIHYVSVATAIPVPPQPGPQPRLRL